MSSLKETERRLRELNRIQHSIEREIEAAEASVASVTAALGDPESYRSGSAGDLSRQYDEASERLRELYDEWERVCGEIADMQTALEELTK